ncbi:hypothetical protein CcaverHIS002_0304690 [Cutaneotrichosporon cavernicola]|uniref:J domain-containing protein n=1 Tax=Cutaneotrichosporon cavernicola TaxID=279322 RepID=A0AA48L1X8_9TREE|nr:uncharacterized protein CcaverHIS019_0304650 [Cutaneotrichosporon cavernicola]BEI82601.1 hypothetical protein CcaverHIS002_0304690 [Cutaneotrichosporon cavernicola]BEI90395.1 hypothetical protein CcaverHIS019_0304650 [Cutaneotrichosporon cavernicola]BEI98171.1 hypothetical protein CcaverHIS631_0304700 [Cutaneotrichosporon cavernicola]BEJ05948.1 hypothetical protein CcaverHIS641_0304700 [Cutaneotrichosporon cavernicola]
METHYDVLGVASMASPSQIARAYRHLALVHHPDKAGGSTEAFQRVSEANETLCDPVRRATYDMSQGIWASKAADTDIDMEYWRAYDEAREHTQPHPAHAHAASHAPRRFGSRFRRRAPSSASPGPHCEFRTCHDPPSGFQYTSAHYSSHGVYWAAPGPMPIPGAMPAPTMSAPIPTPVHHPMSPFPGSMFANTHSPFIPFQPRWSSPFMRPDNTSLPAEERICNCCPLSAPKASRNCKPQSPWSPRPFAEEVTVFISFETPLGTPLRARVLPFFAPLPPLRAPSF